MTDTLIATQYKERLAHYLPAGAVEPVYDYLNCNAVHLHITRERTSKLGDYRWLQPRHPYHEISVNGNLNPYRFLMVMLHEMAHLDTWLQYRNSIAPHGHEWQQNYAALLTQYRHCFPAGSHSLLERYVSRIPLNRRTGTAFEQSLKQYDPGYTPENDLHLDDLPAGTVFALAARPDTRFRSLEKRRTRWLCQHLGNGRQYLVLGTASVIRTNDSD